MKTDRELLEAAAKAAGHEHQWEWPRGAKAPTFLRIKTGSSMIAWNPLTDDGDALRLAVKLKIPLQFPDWQDIARTWGREDDGEGFVEPAMQHNGDLGVATRRAIVRAAAAMAKED